MLSREDSRIIWLLLAAAFVAILNETTMGVAIPHLIGDLGITAVAAQWLTTAFMLTMAVVIPISGFLLQRFTTRAVFIAAMSLFSLGTLIAFLSPGFPLLLVARVVQASGTAIMMPLLMTTLMTLVPAHSRGRMMGRVSIVLSLAPAIGPTMSGLLLDTVGWRWIFGIVLPIALLALAAGARWIHNLGEPTRAPIDVLSIILSAFGFGGIVFGLSQIGGAAAHGASAADAAAADAMSTTTLIVSFSVGVVALGLFIWRQLLLQRTDRALLDLRVFRSLNFSLAIAQMGLLSLAFFGAITVVPLYMQTVLQVSALETGLVVLPGCPGDGPDRTDHRPDLRPLGYACAADPRLDHRERGAVDVHHVRRGDAGVDDRDRADRSVDRPRAFVHTALHGVPRFAPAALLLIRLRGARNSAAGRGGGGHRPHGHRHGRSRPQSSIESGVSEVAAGAAGAQAAFTIAAIVSLPLIVGAFLIRKPVDQPFPAPAAH